MLLPLRWREPRGPLPEGVRVLDASGVLSAEELESVLFLSAGVLVFRETLEPKPIGVGLRLAPREPERMLEVRLTPLPRPSSELRETLEPW